ncbi:MAG: transcription elongation factor GreA [Chloroflexi bacterium]|nr:transcription elongation factor GreA [Chloroflexota bacterium]
MAERVQYITREGRQKLEDELEHLRTVAKREVARRLKESIEDGDITENAGYDEAKREQAFVEGRIRDIEAILANAQLLQDASQRDVVAAGTTVTVAEDGERPETYYIVGAVEADPANGRISFESPLGQALMGRRKGDRVQVQTPGGTLHFRIVEIR